MLFSTIRFLNIPAQTSKMLNSEMDIISRKCAFSYYFLVKIENRSYFSLFIVST